MTHAVRGLVLSLFALSFAHADVIPDGVETIKHEVLVEGMDQEAFADVRFVVYPTQMGSYYRVLKAGETQWFKWTSPHIYAIPRATALPPRDDRDAQRQFFSKGGFPRSDVTMSYMGYVPEGDSRRHVRTVYRPLEIVGKTLRVHVTESAWDGDGNLLATGTSGAPLPEAKEAAPPTQNDPTAETPAVVETAPETATAQVTSPEAAAPEETAEATASENSTPADPPAPESATSTAESSGCALGTPGRDWSLVGLSALALVALVLVRLRRS